MAIRTTRLKLPFPVPPSTRLLEPTSLPGFTAQLSEWDQNSNPIPVVNQMTNFGREYVRHAPWDMKRTTLCGL